MSDWPPPPKPTYLRAWLELARISNLPTVWSNVLVGAMLGWSVVGLPRSVEAQFFGVTHMGLRQIAQVLLLYCVSMSCFYVGGMILNDWIDRHIDAKERPGRPLPSGRIQPSHALGAVLGLFGIGTLLLTATGHDKSLQWGAMLLAAIIAYDVIHKRSPISVLIMGLCRGLVYLAVAIPVMTHGRPDLGLADVPIYVWLCAGGITFYTTALTVVARSEVKDGELDNRKWLAVAMPVVVLATAFFMWPTDFGDRLDPAIVGAEAGQDREPWTFVVIIGFLAGQWMMSAAGRVLTKPAKTIKAILGWLSGMCLVDAYFLSLLGVPWLFLLIPIFCWLITTLGHRKILGT